MSPIIIVLGVLSLSVFTLALSRITPDLVLMTALAILLISEVLTPEQALKGFANEGLMTIGFLFVVAEGLRQTRAVQFIGQLLGQPDRLTGAQSRVMVPTAVLSAFMNNTPVVAMMMPVLDEWAKKLRLSVSHLFLPLSYAAILGGLCTLVGTSTTLVINGLLIETGHPGYSMFELAWVGFPAMILGLIYLVCCTQKLLPERKATLERLSDPP